MYGRSSRAPTFGFAPTQYAPQAYFQPSPVYSYAPVQYEAAPRYYAPVAAYEPVATSTVDELELLEYEEQQLIAQQQQIIAQRRRIAEEKLRIQQEAEQKEYLRQMKLREAALRRQQEQQRQVQLQARQRQLAAHKEAQLEAALRELDAQGQRAAFVQQRAAHTQQRQVEVNPLELLFQAFLGAEPEQVVAKPTQTQQKPRACAPGRACRVQFAVPTGSRPVASSSNAASSSAPKAASSSTSAFKPGVKPTSEKPAAPAKPTIESLLRTLTDRVIRVTTRVQELLHTKFADLTFRSFTNIDNELMQILLALDNLSADTEEAKAARKALVTETMSLLDRVDLYKGSFSESASSASSSSSASNSAANSDDEDSEDEKEEKEEKEEKVVETSTPSAPVLAEASGFPAYPKIEVPEEDIDADALSSSSDSDNEEETVVKTEENPIATSSSAPSVEEPADDSDLIDFEPSAPEAFEEENVEEDVVEDEVAPTAATEDPFGFKAIEEVARRSESSSVSASSDKVPIQIGSTKSKVVIDSPAPARK